MTSIISMSSCGGNTSSIEESIRPSSDESSVIDKDYYEEKDPVLASDSDLAKYDDIPFTYDNKMIMDDIGGSKEVPDPFVYRFNGYYYLYPTTNGGYVKAYKSADLFSWEPVDNGILNRGFVYNYNYDKGGLRPDSQTPYAPEVIYFNGKFYMIASPSGKGHYIFESDSPEGPFTCITENIGHNIDGSFFIDGEENIYLYGASGGSIMAYALDEDMTTFLTNDDGSEIQVPLIDCRVGNWNEGPYMLQRNGSYYLSYCGTHYLSKDYRIDYAYCKEGSDLLKGSSYSREDTIVLSTEDDFFGLGHSSTVLGPDLDSYYIVYHNLENSSVRYLNLSRLSFNGSKMVANDVRPNNLMGMDLPPFYAYGLEEFNQQDGLYLSPNKSEESFTVEFNNIGEGKMIFSYVNQDNYSFIEFKDNAITINKVIDGKSQIKYKNELNRVYDTSVMHTFRLQYHKGKMNLYFDNMEKAYNIDAYFVGGKIGYDINNTFEEIGYTAFSNVALGSSDGKVYNSSVSLANAYDEKLSYLTEGSMLEKCKSGSYVKEDSYNLTLKNNGDRATYRVYEEEGLYSIDLRVPSSSLGKKIGIRVDDGKIEEMEIPNNVGRYTKGDVKLSIGDVYLTQGQHNISIYNIGDEVGFSEVYYSLISSDEPLSVVFDTSFNYDEFRVRNSLNLSNKGIYTDNQKACGVISRASYKNVTVEAEVSIEDIQSSGFVGLLMNVSDYSKNYRGDGDGEDNVNTYRGYLFAIEKDSVSLNYIDFNFSSKLKIASMPNLGSQKQLVLKITQINNNYICYINDIEVININANIGNLSGNVGVFASNSAAYFESLNVYE